MLPKSRGPDDLPAVARGRVLCRRDTQSTASFGRRPRLTPI